MNNHFIPPTPIRQHTHRVRLTPKSMPIHGTSGMSCSMTKESTTPEMKSRTTYCGSNSSSSSSARLARIGVIDAISASPAQYTPSKAHNDRFIPSRSTMNMDLARRALFSEWKHYRSINMVSQTSTTTNGTESILAAEYKRRILSTLFSIPLDLVDSKGEPMKVLQIGVSKTEPSFRTTTTSSSIDPFVLDELRSAKLGLNTPTQQAKLVQHTISRNVPSKPCRILDAPGLLDDYYLNLLSWSKDNVIALGLGPNVYLYDITTRAKKQLHSANCGNGYVASVCWCTLPGKTHLIAVGTSKGLILLIDSTIDRAVQQFMGHSERVGTLAWSANNMLSSGSRDCSVLTYDTRSAQNIVSSYCMHKGEVCGLKWNDDGSCLASGGNDDIVCLWDASMATRTSQGGSQRHPRSILRGHTSAIKALDWCPFNRTVLASGGGTRDKTIRFWNTSSSKLLNSVNVRSQVSSITWSQTSYELCTSHGFTQNDLILWQYPSMTKRKQLKVHKERILCTALDPTNTSIASIGADETLCFWADVFSSSSRKSVGPSQAESLGWHSIR